MMIELEDFTVKRIAENHGLLESDLRKLLKNPEWKHDKARDTVPLNLKDLLVESCKELDTPHSFDIKRILKEKRDFYKALHELRRDASSSEALMLVDELEIEMQFQATS